MSTNQAETAEREIEDFIKHLLNLQRKENPYSYLQFPKCISIFRSIQARNKELEDTMELNAKAYGIIAKLEAENKLLREEWERMRLQLSTDYRRFTEEEFNCVWPDAAEEIAKILSSLEFSSSQK